MSQRFFLPVDLSKRSHSLSDEGLYHQLKNVLRVSIGDAVVVCDGSGNEVEGVVEELSKNRVLITTTEPSVVRAEPGNRVVLYTSIIKKDLFEWVVQKATEVGAKEIVPVVTERTVKMGVRLDRLKVIAKEAAEQSGRGMIPVIHEPIAFTEALSRAQKEGQVLFFDKDGDDVHSHNDIGGVCSIFIGPEGGWSDSEKSLVTEKGVAPVSLGLLTLRAETAAVIATYVANAKCKYQNEK
jgi:16S rRNA (uracil1498-N3)-methyltransferase